MPANNGELVISSHIQTDGNVTYNVGDIITLNVGTRTVNGTTASQCVEYTKGAEKIENTVKKQYKIVGICERPSLENFGAPGYSVFTTGQMSGQGSPGSAGDYQADDRAGVTWLSWRLSSR